LPQYFYIPPNATTRNFYVCLTPPKALHHVVGKDKYRKSTGTADLRKAKPIGARLIAEKLAEWEQLLATSDPARPAAKALTSRSIKDICAQRLYHWMHLDDLGRYEGEGYDDGTLAGLQGLWDSTDRTMRSVIARGKLSQEWESALEVLDLWCGQIDVSVSRTDPLYAGLVQDFAKVELEGVKWVQSRNRGDAVPTPARPAAIGSEMSAMTEVYREHLQASRKGKSVTTAVGLWTRFVDYLGDVPIEAVQPEDIYGFLKHGLLDPDTMWSMKYAHGVVRRTIRSVLSLAITTGSRRGANPVDSVTALYKISDEEEQERLSPRRPYSDAELNKVFGSDWYAPDSTRWHGKMATDLGARYWTPLICMYHGNRVGEVIQLVASDFTLRNEVHCLNIQEEVAGGQPELIAAGVKRSLKNVSTARGVPVHPQLIALGLLDFIQSRREAAGVNALLFPSCIPRPGGTRPILGRSYEQAYLRFVNEDIGKGLGNHGYRHQLEDRIRNVQTPGNQWPAGLGQQYTGRKSTRTVDLAHVAKVGSETDYGEGYTPELMLMYVKLLDFSHIKLPPAYAEWVTRAP
jgi:integrase